MTITVPTPSGKPVWSRDISIADYGGATTKRNSRTEGKTPYAAAFYRELRDNLMGSAYSTTDDSVVHCQNVATARFFASIVRIADKFRNNQQPATASDKLAYWVEVLGHPNRPQDSDAQTRSSLAAKYKTTLGPRRQVVDDSIAALLGDLFVQVHHIIGSSLNSPPTNTFWPGIAPGPAEYDLGGGTWMSERSHIVVEVLGPAGVSLPDYYDLLNAQLFDLLNRILPSWCTFDWSVNTENGITLDVDRLDFGGLGL